MSYLRMFGVFDLINAQCFPFTFQKLILFLNWSMDPDKLFSSTHTEMAGNQKFA